MAPSVEPALNPEPARPTDRKAQHLPPKSYLDAAEEGLEVAAHASGKHSSRANGNGKPSTSVPAKRETFVNHEGEWLSGPKKSKKSESTNKSTRSSQSVDTLSIESDDRTLVEEQFKKSNGHQLTTVKPDDDYEDQMRLDRGEEKRPLSNSRKGHELVSGHRADEAWDRSGIRWAPLQIPLKRRLQTAVVLLHSLSIALFLSSFFLMAAIPLTWPLLFPYTLWILFSTAGSSGSLRRRSTFVRSLPIWSLFASYFPARLHRSEALPPTRKYIFGYHPHGIISHGAFAAFVTEALGFSHLFPGITNTLLTLDSNFRIPLYRDWALALGLASVSKESCENLLSQGGANGEGMGRAITIVIGGARESLDAVPGSLKLVLNRRKGFVKLAARTGADLVPVLAFGENELYDQIRAETHPLVHRVQMALKKGMGFTVPLFFARGVFNYDVGLMPFRHPLNVVVGRPIRVEQQDEPDSKYVDELHARYVEELKRIWEEWRAEFAPDMNAELQIVE